MGTPRILRSVLGERMEMRTLGKSGIKVSSIGLGLMSMSGIYGNANDEESIRVIHHALDKGINHLDSSDMYGWGHNETLLGKALKGRRAGDHPPRAQGSPHRRGAERVFAAVPEGRRGNARLLPRARHLARRLRAA